MNQLINIISNFIYVVQCLIDLLHKDPMMQFVVKS
jgi:hypothetical protein